MKQYILHFCIILASLISCTGKTSDAAPPAEDTVAKQMLQGVWMNEDEVVTMRVAGDTISYSDSTMASAYFAVVRDSLVIRGATEARYEILKQTEHIFEFRNHAGDIVKLLKSDNPDDAKAFTKHAAPPLNQNRLIKRDTVAIAADRKYHVYVQVNPSTYKVIRSTYNQEGIMVDNIYYDNIINVCVYDGGTRLFSRDMRKQDFAAHVPENFIRQSVLSDITVDAITPAGITLDAALCMPDTPTAYIVKMTVSPQGKLTMKVSN
ncbi:MAG: DUF4738 domain-containing protein [Prevotella sp.]|nr:DUF4738 domain-containing protein [Prevotella sp.]